MGGYTEGFKAGERECRDRFIPAIICTIIGGLFLAAVMYAMGKDVGQQGLQLVLRGPAEHEGVE